MRLQSSPFPSGLIYLSALRSTAISDEAKSVPLRLIGTFDLAVTGPGVLSLGIAGHFLRSLRTVSLIRFPRVIVYLASQRSTTSCLGSPALLSGFNAKGNVDASSLSKSDCRSSRRFSIISRSSLGRQVWSSLRQRQMSLRTDLISLKLSSIVINRGPQCSSKLTP
jgi:hypothetical protein